MFSTFKLVLPLWALTGGFILETSAAVTASNLACRYMPGDSGWPSSQEWADLNATVGGRLIATTPLATPCHDPNYNATACAILQEGWDQPQTQ